MTPRRVLVVAHLPTASQAKRNEVAEKLSNISRFSQEQEPGITVYAVLVPRDDDGKSVYAIEEYADMATLEAHNSVSHVKELIRFLGDETVLESKPTIHKLELVEDFRIARPDVTSHEDPYIVFAKIDYAEEAIPTSIPYWKEVVTTSRKESGTLFYALCQDPTTINKLFSLEVYESSDYLWGVHAKSDAVVQNVQHTKDLRRGLSHTHLKMIAGFLYRGS